MSAAIRVVRNVTGSIAGAVESGVSSLASAARGITGKVYDEIGSLAQKIGNTVEKIASDPKMLAAVAVNFAFPGAGSAIGNWILGAETAAAIGATATTAIGNACLNTAMNGGDMKKGIETAVTSYVGNVGAQEITKFVQNAELVPDAFAKNVGTTTSYAAIQAALGKDPTAVLLTGGANACAQLLTQQIPGFDNMPQNARDAITRTTAAALQGKSGGAVNAAIDYATNLAKDEFQTYKSANDAGFNYDVDAYKDAKQIGITNPDEYKYAKSIGATSIDDYKIGKDIGAQDAADLDLAKTLGINNAKDFDYAKQVGAQDSTDFNLAKTLGVDNSDDLNYAKTIGTQTAGDFNLAKTLGIESPNDFSLAKTLGLEDRGDLDYAKTLGIATKDDLDLAKNIKAADIFDVNFAKTLGLKSSEDLDYAKMIGVQNADEYDFAKTVGAKDITDLNIAKNYGITDKDTLSKYSDFLGHGTEKASTSVIKGADGSEMTIDNEGNVVKYMIPTEQGLTDVTKDVSTVASRFGGYTMVGDDGSTITINANGTVSAEEAPEQTDESGQPVKPSRTRLGAYNIVQQAQQNRAQTQASEAGGLNEQTIAATQRMRENPLNKTGYEITAQDVADLMQAFGEPQYVSQEIPEETGMVSDVQVGGQFQPEANYLGEIGQKPDYLGEYGDLPDYLQGLSPTKGGQQLPGQDTGAPSDGGYQTGPVIGGGGGPSNTRQVYGGPAIGGGGGPSNTRQVYGTQATPYGYQVTAGGGANIEDQLRAAGLQDQSQAETNRLLNVQGPMAIGAAPVRTAGLPTGIKPPVTPTVTLPQVSAPAVAPIPADQTQALTEQIRKMQESGLAGLRQIQEYANQAARTGGTSAQELLRYMLTKPPESQKGTIAYRDAFGNLVTRR